MTENVVEKNTFKIGYWNIAGLLSKDKEFCKGLGYNRFSKNMNREAMGRNKRQTATRI